MTSHHTFLTAAAKEAERGIRNHEGGPFGSLLVLRGKIIAKAHNTVLKTKNPTRHAEINAIGMASQKLKTPFLTKSFLYTTTEPCPMCFAAIHWARIDTLVYATTIEDVKKLGFNELVISSKKLKLWGKSPIKLIQKKNNQCSGLLKTWNKQPNRQTY